MDRDDTMETFFKAFYPKQLIDLNYFIEFYKSYPATYFLDSIIEHMKDKAKFNEKIIEGKKKARDDIIERPKWDAKAFVAEVNKEVGPDDKIPERYTEPMKYIDVEEHLMLEEPIMLEDLDAKKYTKIKIKDPLAPSVLAVQDPIDNKPKVVYDEKRGVMTFAEPPKPKAVEPPKEEPKDEEVEEDKPVEEIPDDFGLFEYDLLNNKK